MYILNNKHPLKQLKLTTGLYCCCSSLPTMPTLAIKETDFESPAFEYLRSFENMSNFYYKLLALNYNSQFRATYKCPPIHQYYFSLPHENPSEQQYQFACLCAWLIKDKCQMNLQLEPDEYEDPDVITSVIMEALILLLVPDDQLKTHRDPKSIVGFPQTRLKSGYGPEVIWTLNILADRALELLADDGQLKGTSKIVFAHRLEKVADSTNSITIGQPYVGGGLTTRPLGSYQIDDASLLFDDEDTEMDLNSEVRVECDRQEWLQKAERIAQSIEKLSMIETDNTTNNWRKHLKSATDAKLAIDDFLNNSVSSINSISLEIDSQLKVINERELLLQTNLEAQLADFIIVYSSYKTQLEENLNLSTQVNDRTDNFQNYNQKLKTISSQINTRLKELKDGSKLKQLESLISQLEEENKELDLRIGLMLTLFSKMQTQTPSSI